MINCIKDLIFLAFIVFDSNKCFVKNDMHNNIQPNSFFIINIGITQYKLKTYKFIT